MEIYSRWGELLFISEDINEGWDGRKEGKSRICPTGVYMYNIEVINVYDQFFKYVDNFLLIR